MGRLALEIAFLGLAAALWAILYGYPLALLAARARRRRAVARRLPESELPPVAVVVATLDERERIDARLDELARTEYPRDRLRVVVADGGSTDGTLERVRARSGEPVTLLELGAGRAGGLDGGSSRKSAQVAAALATIAEPIVVISDADARLAPDCIRGLVEALVSDPRLVLAGARVVPATELPEERLHWQLVGLLSRLEGEVLGAATPSGVALAFRREAVDLDAGAACDDVHLAVAACANGGRAEIVWSSIAVESRAPDSAAGLVALRRRRGRAFRTELRRARAGSRRFRLFRAVRILLFDVVPWGLLALASLGMALAFAGGTATAGATALAFVLPLLAAGLPSLREGRSLATMLAPLRWAALSLVALVTLRRQLHPVSPSLREEVL